MVALAGEAARRALRLTADGDGTAYLSAPVSREGRGPSAPAPGSEGPSYDGGAKPDLGADGVAMSARPGGGAAVVAGSSVAAARVAAAAVRLHRADPGATADELAARLVGTARPPAGGRASPLRSGAGVPDPARAAAAGVVADPPLLALRREDARTATGTVTLRGPAAAAAAGGARVSLARSAGGRLRATVMSAGAVRAGTRPAAGRGGRTTPATTSSGAEARELRVRIVADGSRLPALVTGRLRLGGSEGRVVVPLLLPPRPPPPRLGSPALTEADGRRGVRFALGRVERTRGRVRVEPVDELALELVDARGARVRELTPPGRARDLLPGEYAYALSRGDLESLPRGRYRFVARARGLAGRLATRRSPAFAVPSSPSLP